MAQEAAVKQSYRRFTAVERMEHMILLVTFTGLAVTGMPQTYAAQPWAKTVIELLGGIESVRIIHRFLATLLMAEAIFHGGVVSYRLFVLGRRASMMPGIRDLRDAIHWIGFNLGLRKEHPHLPRYNFGEKAEYLAVVWGTILMVITGFMMWNPIATSTVLPGSVIPAARAAHSSEALLAVLSIVVWHMYNVHIKRFNRSMFTGSLSREAMEEEHGEELHKIESGEIPQQLPDEVIALRKRRFWPYAAMMTVALTGGLIWFITLETTAIQTIPRRENREVAPEVILTEGDAEIGQALWPTLRCARCHGDTAAGETGVPALRGTALTFDEFFTVVRSGIPEHDMPAFTPLEISDTYLLHLWEWLRQTDEPAS